MGSSESSQRQLSVKNEDFKMPPIQITRSVLSRLEEHASNAQSKEEAKLPNEDLASDRGEKACYQAEDPVKISPVSATEDYFPFKTDHSNSVDPLLDYKDNWEKYVAKPDFVVIGVGRSGLPTIETVTAMQVRKEKQEELLSNDLFWSSKIQKLMDHYTASVEFAHGEFSRKLEEIRRNVPILTTSNGCQTLKTMLGHCYVQNSKNVLKCSNIVQQFTRCVECEVETGATAPQPKLQKDRDDKDLQEKPAKHFKQQTHQ